MQSSHVTAQEEFAALLKQRVGPDLRQSGFKGSSGRYELRVGGNALLVGLQRSSWSTSEQIEFTLNWTIVHGTVWQEVRRREPWVGNWPNHNCDVLGTTWNGRIHDLVEGADPMDWWVIDAPTDSGVHTRNSSVMEEVVARVNSLLLPLAQTVLADDDAYLDAVLRRHSEVPGTPPEALYLVSLVRARGDERELRELVERLTGTAGSGTVHKDARRLGSQLAAELGVPVQLDAEDDEHEDAGGVGVASREDIAEELWRCGEDELALAALDCDDATLRRITGGVRSGRRSSR